MQLAGERTVLVVEDEILIGVDLCETVESAGYRVVGPAKSAREACSIVEREAPDLAVIDIRLRDGNSRTLMALLCQKGIPFVVHCALRQDADLALGGETTLWLPKPASSHDLLSMLGMLEHSTAKSRYATPELEDLTR